jgi:tetratricopeptide (TPR) repeat protein
MSVERGTVLLRTERYDLAEQEFRSALAANPNDAQAHAMMGFCLLRRKQYAEATAAAQQAISLKPDWGMGYYVLGSILFERERIKESVEVIEQAIAVEPFNASFLALLGSIRLSQHKFPEALAAADRGLEIDPQHSACLNVRGIALVKLGRKEEASATIDGALARDPENATTHANQGWALLHRGDYRAAQHHFREALRLEPNSEWAKSGIVEALKARNPVYRLIFRYFLFMSRMTPRVRWFILLGGWFGYQILRSAEASNPAIRPVALPLMIAYIAFVLMSWLAVPASNLMLRLDRFGRHVLSRDQTVASNWFAACLLVAAGLAIWALATRNYPLLLPALFAGLLSIPITSTFRCTAGWPRQAMALYSAALAILAGCVSVLLFSPEHWLGMDSTGDLFGELVTALIIGFLLSSVLANVLMQSRVRK